MSDLILIKQLRVLCTKVDLKNTGKCILIPFLHLFNTQYKIVPSKSALSTNSIFFPMCDLTKHYTYQSKKVGNELGSTWN